MCEKHACKSLPPGMTLPSLYLTFAKIGTFMFGGGFAMLPLLEREVVHRRHWATVEELADYYALGQCTPGIIAVNTATFIGAKRSQLGGIVATLGLVTPSMVIIALIAACLRQFQSYPAVQHAFVGVRACVCVLICNAVIQLARSSIVDLFSAILFVAVFALSAFLGWSPALLVATCGVIGLAKHLMSKPRSRS